MIINEVELATKLAHNALIDEVFIINPFMHGCVVDEEDLWELSDDETFVYKEEFQKIFDEKYDYYSNMISISQQMLEKGYEIH